eukprot:4588419-Prymnesium_polylepis.1
MYTRAHPKAGAWAKVDDTGEFPDELCAKCPECRQAFASVWDPLGCPNLRNCLPFLDGESW